MISDFSKNKALLLGLFFTNPDREYYIQEIGRILGKKPGAFQRMLYKLESQGILSSRFSANARFFQANQAHPLFEETKSIVFKTIGIAGRLMEALTDLAGIEIAFIYGSYAKGQERPDSDIDLMIVGAPDEGVLYQRIDDLESSLRREINFRVLSSLDIVEAAQGSEPFLRRVLEEPQIFLVGHEDTLRAMAQSRPDQTGGSGS